MLTEVSIHDFLWSGGQVMDADLRRHDDVPNASASVVRAVGKTGTFDTGADIRTSVVAYLLTILY
jgi:hypothetical protein